MQYLHVHVGVLRVAAAVVQLRDHRLEVRRQAIPLRLLLRLLLLLACRLLQQGHGANQPVGQQLVEHGKVAAWGGGCGEGLGFGAQGTRRRERVGRAGTARIARSGSASERTLCVERYRPGEGHI